MMPSARSLSSRLRALCALVALLAFGTAPAAAQSVDAVVSAMEDTYRSQMESVYTYILETDMYTTYHRKVETDDGFTVDSATQLKGQESVPMSGSSTTPTSMFETTEALRQHAAYDGTETIGGTRCHVLTINEPSKMDGGLSDAQAEQIRYYINAQTHQPRRIALAGSSRKGAPSSMTIDLLDYRTVDGLSVPYRMEFQTELSPQQKQQMNQLKNLPKSQRDQMKQMMGVEQFERFERLMDGKPMVVTVTDVKVNAPIPDGVFENS
jgi:hypothetical protein